MNKEEIVDILAYNLAMKDYIEVTKYITDLEQENKQLKEIIEEEKLIFEEINESSVPHKLFYNVDSGEDENSVEYKVNQLIRNQKKIIDELKKGK